MIPHACRLKVCDGDEKDVERTWWKVTVSVVDGLPWRRSWRRQGWRALKPTYRYRELSSAQKFWLSTVLLFKKKKKRKATRLCGAFHDQPASRSQKSELRSIVVTCSCLLTDIYFSVLQWDRWMVLGGTTWQISWSSSRSCRSDWTWNVEVF